MQLHSTPVPDLLAHLFGFIMELAEQSNNPVLILFGILSSVATLVAFLGDRVFVFQGVPSAGSSNMRHGRMAIGSLAAFCMISATLLVVAGKVSRTLAPSPPSVPSGTTIAIDVTDLSDSAFKLGADHRYAEALAIYRVIEHASPRFPLLHLNMAYCSRELGDLSAALGYAEKAVQEAPTAHQRGPQAIGDAYYNLAAIRFAAGDRKGSVNALARAVGEGFPEQCDVARNDPDLQAMAKDKAFVPYVQKILVDGTKDCGPGK